MSMLEHNQVSAVSEMWGWTWVWMYLKNFQRPVWVDSVTPNLLKPVVPLCNISRKCYCPGGRAAREVECTDEPCIKDHDRFIV